jgi:CubicO group peptidase (beta-lactamase class C family)
MSADLKITGRVAPGYAAVRDAFATDPRGGSALTVLRDGEPVVELCEGWQDAARTRPWDENTLVNVYSVGKPVIALAAMILVDRGLIGLDDPIARHWPSFQTPASVRDALAHTAGLPIFPVPRGADAWSDWDLLCADLAAASPMWEPGTVAAEHALTYGHLLGELVRRVDGRPPAVFVAEEIAGPYGLDFGFGLSDFSRCAELEYDAPDWYERNLGSPGSVHALAVGNPAGARDLAVVNSAAWRSATVPAVNLHATATSIARFYAVPAVARLAERQYEGVDRFLERDVVWGLGVQIEVDGTWGMGGLGGNAGWFDPAGNLAIGYVTRRLGDFAAVDRIEAALRA